MTECTDRDVREALPELLHGRLGEVDTATMLAHVEACQSCAAELELMREIRRTAPIAPKLDIDRIVAALPQTVPMAPHNVPARRFGLPSIVLSLAAAATMIVTGSMMLDRAPRDAAAPEAIAVSTPPVVTAPLEIPAESAVIRSIPVEGKAEAPSLSLVASVQDLTDAELETLLSELDQMDGIPDAEPETMDLSIDSIESEG